MEFKHYKESSLPPQDEIDEAHGEILHGFIKKSEGLRSMLLIGVRDMGNGTDAVEVACGGTTSDMLRASASILEAIVARAPEDLKDSEQAEALRQIIKIIYTLGGDDPEEVKRINDEDEDVTVN